jgi:hypothetical protein
MVRHDRQFLFLYHPSPPMLKIFYIRNDRQAMGVCASTVQGFPNPIRTETQPSASSGLPRME